MTLMLFVQSDDDGDNDDISQANDGDYDDIYDDNDYDDDDTYYLKTCTQG